MTNHRRVAIESVPVGAMLKAPIADPENPRIKLLGEGIAVSESFLSKLRSRGIEEVVIASRDLAQIETFNPQGRARKVPPAPGYVRSERASDVSREIDNLVDAEQSLTIEATKEPVSLSIHRPHECRYHEGLQQQWASDHDQSVEGIREWYNEAGEGHAPSEARLRQTCERILAQLEEDADAAVCLAASPFATEYPSRHSVHVAAMSMAIGVEVGLDHSSLLDLGIGCLLHDVGMQKVGLNQFESDATITTGALRDLSDHPVHALETAAAIGDGISTASRLVAYQIHERLDGSGYPRGRTANQIHVLAKIAAVADEFVALLAPRPHRLAIQGYFAIRHVVADMKQGKFDPRAVRALIMTTGLFPVGSYVVMTNDHVARIIRSGREDFDKPTIEMWESNDLSKEPVVVSLQQDETVQIVGSIPMPRAA